MNLTELKRLATKAAGRLEAARSQLKRDIKKLRDSEDRLFIAEQALDELKQAALDTQHRIHSQICFLVNHCIQEVFGNSYSLAIEFQGRGGRTTARLVLSKDGQEVSTDDGVGGGIIDLASFALRVAALTIHQPPLAPLLILDEPFKFVSADHRPAVKMLLEKLAERLDMQIIMVTHIEELQTGQVISLD